MILPMADPLAKCALLPRGLGVVAVPKLTDSRIDVLLMTMEESKAISDAGEAASKNSIVPAATGPAASPVSKSSGSGRAGKRTTPK